MDCSGEGNLAAPMAVKQHVMSSLAVVGQAGQEDAPSGARCMKTVEDVTCRSTTCCASSCVSAACCRGHMLRDDQQLVRYAVQAWEPSQVLQGLKGLKGQLRETGLKSGFKGRSSIVSCIREDKPAVPLQPAFRHVYVSSYGSVGLEGLGAWHMPDEPSLLSVAP